jgi:hypothetical protein
MCNLALKSLAMESSIDRQWLASATLVLFLLMQFAATVHAAEHAFHQEKSYCAALNNVENNKLFSHHVAGFQLTNVVTGFVATLLLQEIVAATFYSYHSRAPPQITV